MPKRDDDTPEGPKRSKEERRAELRSKLAALTEERADIRTDESSAGRSRLTEIQGEMRRLGKKLFDLEDDVQVQVPRSVTGEPFRINDQVFAPGSYTVKTSVAETLLYMIDQNRQAELNMVKNRGRKIHLGNIGELAETIATIQAE